MSSETAVLTAGGRGAARRLRSRALKYLSACWIEARQQLAYRGEFALRGLMIAVFMFVFVSLWRTVYAVSGASEIAGFRLSQVIWYLAMTETVILSRSSVYDEISAAVKSGDVAYDLARPYNYLGFLIAHSLGRSLPRVALNAAASGVVVLAFTRRVETSVAGALGFALTALLGLVLDAMVGVLIGLGAFWFEEVRPLSWIYSKLLMSVGGMFLPLEMLPNWLRRISELLPFRFVIHAPARLFVAYDPRFLLRALAGQALYGTGLAILLTLIWRRGRERVVVHGG